MSLPSIVIFYKEGQEIRREFINCGWRCNEESVKNGLKRTLEHIDEEFDWDVAEAYEMKIKKEELINKEDELL